MLPLKPLQRNIYQYLQFEPGRRLPSRSVHQGTPQPLGQVGWESPRSKTDKTLKVLPIKDRAQIKYSAFTICDSEVFSMLASLPSKRADWEERHPDRGRAGSTRGSSCSGCCFHEAVCRSDSRSRLWGEQQYFSSVSEKNVVSQTCWN